MSGHVQPLKIVFRSSPAVIENNRLKSENVTSPMVCAISLLCATRAIGLPVSRTSRREPARDSSRPSAALTGSEAGSSCAS